jgi:hypothetical protein
MQRAKRCHWLLTERLEQRRVLLALSALIRKPRPSPRDLAFINDGEKKALPFCISAETTSST